MNKSLPKNQGPAVLSPIAKSPSIPRQVADQVIGLIMAGTLKPGERLPSEETMTRRLGISRITLREAKKLLEARGYIESRGKGSKYAAIPEDGEKTSIEDLVSIDQGKIWELLAVRRILDSEAASKAATCASDKEKKALRALRDKAVSLGFDDRIPIGEEGGRLYAEFFDTLSRSTHNTIFCHLRKSVNTILTGAFPYSRKKLSSIKGSSKSIIEQISAIMDAIGSGDPDSARTAMIAHIDYLEKAIRKAIVPAES